MSILARHAGTMATYEAMRAAAGDPFKVRFESILSPTEGTLKLAGFKTQNMSAEQLAGLRRKHVGFVFQSHNLVPTLTAVENVMMPLLM